jgi:dTMP kinase
MMFITFEGSEGCGKSTQIQLLAEFLQQKQYKVLLTREPGGTEIGEQIREILAKRENIAMQLRTEILLFQASRAQLVEELIKPHLAKGYIVLCDRYADSTIAYQGYGYRNIELPKLRSLVDFATDGLKPDLTILLDLDVEIGLQRRERGGQINRLDTYDLEFYRRVRAGYLEMARQEASRWVIVNAAQPLLQVQNDVRRCVLQRLTDA